MAWLVSWSELQQTVHNTQYPQHWPPAGRVLLKPIFNSALNCCSSLPPSSLHTGHWPHILHGGRKVSGVGIRVHQYCHRYGDHLLKRLVSKDLCQSLQVCLQFSVPNRSGEWKIYLNFKIPNFFWIFESWTQPGAWHDCTFLIMESLRHNPCEITHKISAHLGH